MASHERLLRRSEVLNRLGVSNTTLTDRVRRGLIAQPISIGVRSVAWRESDIVAFIERCAQLASAPTNPNDNKKLVDNRAAFWQRVRDGEALHPRARARKQERTQTKGIEGDEAPGADFRSEVQR